VKGLTKTPVVYGRYYISFYFWDQYYRIMLVHSVGRFSDN